MQKPRLLDEVRRTCRVRHHSIRTEKAYTSWIKRYIYFHNIFLTEAVGAEVYTPSLRGALVDCNVTGAVANQG